MKEFHQILDTDGFDSIIMCAQLLCFGLIGFQVRAAEHDYGKVIKFGAMLQPLENIEPVQSGHFQIEQKQTGEGVPLAICIRVLAGEVIYGFLAVAGYEEWIWEGSSPESQAHKQYIVRLVLGQENETQVSRCRQYQNVGLSAKNLFLGAAKQASFWEAVLCSGPEKA